MCSIAPRARRAAAAAAKTSPTSAGSHDDASAIGSGKAFAPLADVSCSPLPWKRIGMPKRESLSAVRCIAFMLSTERSGVPCSCAIFSSRVMRASKSATRSSTGADGRL